MRKNIIQTDPRVGKILVSDPFLRSRYFKRSVILLGEHDKNGSVGFILNKPTDLNINDAIEDFPDFKASVYYGGPVQIDTIHFIHTFGNKLEGSKEILPGIYWGGNLETLILMIETRQVAKNEVRFFAGYSGWDQGQLNEEVRDKMWLVSQGKIGFTFSESPESLWGDVMRLMGSPYAVLANLPEYLSLN